MVGLQGGTGTPRGGAFGLHERSGQSLRPPRYRRLRITCAEHDPPRRGRIGHVGRSVSRRRCALRLHRLSPPLTPAIATRTTSNPRIHPRALQGVSTAFCRSPWGAGRGSRPHTLNGNMAKGRNRESDTFTKDGDAFYAPAI